MKQVIKDTHKENTLLNKTAAPTRRTNIYIWAIGILNQLFMRDSYTQNKFCKKMKKSLVKIHSLRWDHFVLPIQFVLTLAFDRAILYGNVAL